MRRAARAAQRRSHQKAIQDTMFRKNRENRERRLAQRRQKDARVEAQLAQRDAAARAEAKARARARADKSEEAQRVARENEELRQKQQAWESHQKELRRAQEMARQRHEMDLHRQAKEQRRRDAAARVKARREAMLKTLLDKIETEKLRSQRRARKAAAERTKRLTKKKKTTGILSKRGADAEDKSSMGALPSISYEEAARHEEMRQEQERSAEGI